MFPKYHEFPEQTMPQEQTPEQIPDAPIIASCEPITSPQDEDKAKRVIIPPENAPEQKKKSILAGIFGRKEKKEKATEYSKETKDMLKEIAGI